MLTLDKIEIRGALVPKEIPIVAKVGQFSEWPFVIVDVYINWQFSLMLIPVAALGHFFGLKVHDRVIENDTIFKRWMGGALVLICIAGLTKVIT